MMTPSVQTLLGKQTSKEIRICVLINLNRFEYGNHWSISNLPRDFRRKIRMHAIWQLKLVVKTRMANDTSADIFARALRDATGNDTAAPASSTPSPLGSKNSALGGFLVCLDVPTGTEFGVDYEVFRTGAAFRGVKFLPLGLHLVVFRAREQRHGVRQGFFVNVTRSAQVIVREWSAEKEELGPPRPGLNLEHLERACDVFFSLSLPMCVCCGCRDSMYVWLQARCCRSSSTAASARTLSSTTRPGRG